MSSYEQKYLKYKQKYVALKEQYPFVQGESIKQKYVALKEQYPFVQGDSIKQKYVALKEQMIGGGKYTPQISRLVSSVLSNNDFIMSNHFNIFDQDDFILQDYKLQLDKIKDKIIYKNISVNGKLMSFSNAIQNITNTEIFDYFGINKLKDCNIEELMTLPNYKTTCKNVTKVSGGCGFPSFENGNKEISDIQRREFDNIIDIITTKFKNESEPKYLDLVLGATTYLFSSFNERDHSFGLIINQMPKFLNYKTFIDKLNQLPSLKNSKLCLNDYFPLSHNFPNSKHILDRIIDLHNNGVKVRITNRMCGTCHRSLYYLVKHGIEYIVSPEQLLGEQDTKEIQKCFK